MENTPEVKSKKAQRINEKKGSEEINLTTVCRDCGKVHFAERDNSDTVSKFIKQYRTIIGWLIQQKCNFCTSPKTMELFINGIELRKFWDYINSEVMEDIPERIEPIPKTKSEAIKYFVNECKNVLEYREQYLENAQNKKRFDLVKPYSPINCSVNGTNNGLPSEIKIYKENTVSNFEINSYEYEKLKKAFWKGVVLSE